MLQIGAETPNQGRGTTQPPSTRVEGAAPHPLPWGQDPVQGPHQARALFLFPHPMLAEGHFPAASGQAEAGWE